MKKLVPSLLSLFLFGSCHSISDNILHSFQTVDSSLERSNKQVFKDNMYTYYYLEIKQKGNKNPGWVRHADSIYLTNHNTVALLERIKQILQEKDSIGEDSQIPAQLLIRTPLADSLKTSLISVADRCYAGLISPDKKSSLDSCLRDIQMIRSSQDWMVQYFSNTPTVAAITILNYFKMECVKATTITLANIDNNLK